MFRFFLFMVSAVVAERISSYINSKINYSAKLWKLLRVKKFHVQLLIHVLIVGGLLTLTNAMCYNLHASENITQIVTGISFGILMPLLSVNNKK